MTCKICKTCNIEKSVSEFGTYKDSRDAKNPKTRTRKSCKACRVIEVSSVYHSNPEVKKRNNASARKSHLKNKYNMTEIDYEQMVQDQNSKCKICNCSADKLNIDHCHTTGKVRGLLCWDCNTGLGKLKDNINSLLNAVKYLEAANEKK